MTANMNGFYTLSGEQINVSASDLISSGGEADVYSIPSKDYVLIKIFNRTNVSILNKLKIFLLSDKNFLPEFKQRDNCPYAFPLLPLFKKETGNTYNDIVGYVMYKRSGSSFHSLMNMMKIKSGKSLHDTKRSDLVMALIDFLTCVQDLHNKDIIIGDISLRNVLYDETQKKIFIIDNDSFQFKLNVSKQAIEEVMSLNNGKKMPYKSKVKVQEDMNTIVQRDFFCEVATIEYTPPELQEKDFTMLNRTVNHELFSIAVFIFQILMLGKHPYATKNGNLDMKESIKEGNFPYRADYSKQKDVPNGAWALLWSHLPHSIQDEFIDTFYKKKKRTSVKKWLQLLNNYYGFLLKNPNKDVLIYNRMAKNTRKDIIEQNINFIQDQYFHSLNELI